MIIHISGTPGSGKSTLGIKIKKMYPKFIVHDTDCFLTKADHKKIRESSTITKATKIWKNTLKKKIDAFLKRHENKVIILTGDLTNGSPTGDRYEINAHIGIFLEVDLKTLILRYYKREICDELLKSKTYQDNIVNQVMYIPSTDEFIKMNKKDIIWHKKHNFISLNEKQILNLIKHISNLYRPPSDATERYYLISNEDKVVSFWFDYAKYSKVLSKNVQCKCISISKVPFKTKDLEKMVDYIHYIDQLDYAVKMMLKNKVKKKLNKNIMKKMITYFKLPNKLKEF